MEFKNLQDYMDQRKALLTDAENLINEVKIDEANKKMDDVRALDKGFEDFRTANANLNALNNNPAVVPPAVPVQEGMSDMSFGDGAKEAEKTDAASDTYKAAWLKVMKGNKLSEDERKTVDTVNAGKHFSNAETTSEHTYLIPVSVQKGIWERAAEEHPVLNDLLATHVKGDIEIIKNTSKESDADWVEEKDSSADADFTEGKLRLTGCEIAKSVTISWKLKKMNDQEYEAYLIKKLGEKVGNAIAKAVFHGKGKPNADEHKPQAKGFITALEAEDETPRIIKYKEAAGITYKNLTSLFALIPASYLNGASIYAKSTTIWERLANILDANKRPIFVPEVTSGGVGRIFGITVKAEDGVNDGEVAIANLGKGYAFNFNEEMTIYTEEHVKLRNTDYMAYGIADGDVITTEAFGVLQLDPSV